MPGCPQLSASEPPTVAHAHCYCMAHNGRQACVYVCMFVCDVLNKRGNLKNREKANPVPAEKLCSTRVTHVSCSLTKSKPASVPPLTTTPNLEPAKDPCSAGVTHLSCTFSTKVSTRVVSVPHCCKIRVWAALTAASISWNNAEEVGPGSSPANGECMQKIVAGFDKAGVEAGFTASFAKVLHMDLWTPAPRITFRGFCCPIPLSSASNGSSAVLQKTLQKKFENTSGWAGIAGPPGC
eukprot:1145262-Pelagomonas_calceolata.AAC.3